MSGIDFHGGLLRFFVPPFVRAHKLDLREGRISMYTPTMLYGWLRDVVLRFHSGSGGMPNLHGGIKLLDAEPLRPECLYVGESATVSRLILQKQLPQEPLYIVCAGSLQMTEEGDLPSQLWLLETSLSLAPLYNRIQEHVHRFLVWDQELQKVVHTNSGLQELLQQAAPAFPATLLLVNVGFKHIASIYHPDVSDPSADELRRDGYQSYNTIQAVRRQTPIRGGKKRGFVEYVSQESGNYTIVWMIKMQNILAARLVIILNGNHPDPSYSDLARILANYVTEYMFSNHSIDYGMNAAFGSLAADLIEFRLTDPEELEQRLKSIQLAVKRYYHVLLISFGDKQDLSNIPRNHVINLLERIFPFSNITTYRGEILLIIRKTNRGIRPVYDEEHLLEILNRYNGHAAFSNFSKDLISLSPMYYQTKAALRLGSAMDSNQRIYYYEDYSIYQIIELASQSAPQDMGSRNMVHLCHPALISLMNHDKQAGGNLTEVLYAYLRCERNAAEAAKSLYMHRNTMLYKVRKIEEIIGQSLDDPTLRERLLFSYHVLEYMRRYRKEDMLILKRNGTKDSVSGNAGKR